MQPGIHSLFSQRTRNARGSMNEACGTFAEDGRSPQLHARVGKQALPQYQPPFNYSLRQPGHCVRPELSTPIKVLQHFMPVAKNAVTALQDCPTFVARDSAMPCLGDGSGDYGLEAVGRCLGKSEVHRPAKQVTCCRMPAQRNQPEISKNKQPQPKVEITCSLNFPMPICTNRTLTKTAPGRFRPSSCVVEGQMPACWILWESRMMLRG